MSHISTMTPDYYSSSYSGIFWPVISLLSDSGSFPDRVSSKLGSAWSGSTTTFDAERLKRCCWLSFCATAANSIFDASSGLCNYAMGSPQVGFFFRVEPPTILYITCLVSILVSAFYFKVLSWMPYSPSGTQPLGFAPLQPFGV